MGYPVRLCACVIHRPPPFPRRVYMCCVLRPSPDCAVAPTGIPQHLRRWRIAGVHDLAGRLLHAMICLAVFGLVLVFPPSSCSGPSFSHAFYGAVKVGVFWRMQRILITFGATGLGIGQHIVQVVQVVGF